jgi:hypothetical protein
MTNGISVSGSAVKAVRGGDGKPLTLADYASTSGILLELPGGIYVNSPIADFNPNFVKENTRYILDFKEESFFVRDKSREVEVKPIPVAGFYNKTNKKGRKYTDFSITHTDRVRASPIAGCANSCKFCDMPRKFSYRKKDPDDLVESIQVALDDAALPAKHIMLSGGTPKPEDYEYLNNIYKRVASAFGDTPVDIMMTPVPGLLDLERLRDFGVNALCINIELYNEESAKKIMPEKHGITRQVYLDFIERAFSIFGEGKIRSLLMVGLESMEDTLMGVKALAQRGCDPVLSPFRPDPVTPLRDARPPTVEFLVELYEKAGEIVEKHPPSKLGPRCIPCMHNTLTFPDDSGKYFYS